MNRSWCSTCDEIAKPDCYQEKHKVTDYLKKDVEEHDMLVDQVESKAEDVIGKREEGERPLVAERDQLKTRLNTVEAQIEENQISKEKLRSVINACKEMKQLPPFRKSSVFIRKTLIKKLKEVKEELKVANNFLSRSNTHQRVGHLREVFLSLICNNLLTSFWQKIIFFIFLCVGGRCVI